MINCKNKTVKVEQVVSITCDVCGKTYSDGIEMQEFHYVSFTGGYGSVFGDGNSVECEICQHCLREMILPYCRLKP